MLSGIGPRAPWKPRRTCVCQVWNRGRCRERIYFPNLQIAIKDYGSLWDPGEEAKPDVPPDFTDGFFSLFTGQTKTSALDMPALEHLKLGPLLAVGVQFLPFESQSWAGLARVRWKKPAYCLIKIQLHCLETIIFKDSLTRASLQIYSHLNVPQA